MWLNTGITRQYKPQAYKKMKIQSGNSACFTRQHQLYICISSELLRTGLSGLLEKSGDFDLHIAIEGDFRQLCLRSGTLLITGPEQVERHFSLLKPAIAASRVAIMLQKAEPEAVSALADKKVPVMFSAEVSKGELLQAVYALVSGQSYYSPALHRMLIAHHHKRLQKQAFTKLAQLPGLTAREQEIFFFIKKGLTNKQIATDMQISINTVATHRKNMLRKFGARNVAEMINKSL